MSVSKLTPSTQNYLKEMWLMQEWSDEPITVSVLAERMGLKLSSVSDAMRKLAAEGLVNHAPYTPVTLTEQGRIHAIDMVRRHRLIETFLVETLGYEWDEVHEEAESLEHAVSDVLIQRMDAFLGHPTRDPHGDPIPLADGTITQPEAALLYEFSAGDAVVVERISDDNPELLQFLAGKGIGVGSELKLGEAEPFADTVQLRAGDEGLSLGHSAASKIWVRRL
ncbi:metal-dependent transcriptional regulator [Micrococcoides hystricis]|uniref:Manganese transport regulator n=1 Tax=Micrococcoides hystricis TaxID=1572761 RepID=A0ABV6PDV1_9MICC